MIKVSNYAPTRYRGAVSCGVSDWPTHNSGTPRDPAVAAKCSSVVFGAVFGDYREADLFVDLAPGESVTVDPQALDASVFQYPEIGDPAAYGRPVLEAVVNGHVVHALMLDPIRAETNGARIRVYAAARWDRLPFVECWVEFVPGQPWANWRLLFTCANPEVEARTWTSPTDVRLGWSTGNALAVVAGLKPTVVLRAGETIAHGQARGFAGTVGWQPLDGQPAESAYAMALNGVVAFDTALRSPLGLPLPELPQQFGAPLTWANRYLAEARDVLAGYQAAQVGVAATSGQTGAQEDQGYAQGGECSIEPGNVLPSFFAAMGMARRPCHWLEADGSLLDPARHPDLVFDAGRPHWHPNVSPDRLGLPQLPTTLETCGWFGPDREHWFGNRLWFALAATGDPLLQRLAEHQAIAFLFGETVRPGWSTSHAGTSRGVGWTCLVALNLLHLLRDRELRAKVLARLIERVELVLLPELEPSAQSSGCRVMGRHPASDLRSGIASSYPWWWQTWQQAVGSFGLYMLGTSRELQRERPDLAARVEAMAIAFAVFLVEHGSTEDQSFGLKTWETVGIREDGQPLTAAEFVHGQGATFTGEFRHWAQPLAFWVAARGGHQRARVHYQRLQAEARQGTRQLVWFPPLVA